MKIYIVMEIGCIECGEDSKIAAIFFSKEEAEKFSKCHKPAPIYSGTINIEIFEWDLQVK